MLGYDEALGGIGILIAAVSIAIGIVHFYGGLLTVKYKPAGLRLLKIYALLAILLDIGEVVLLVTTPVAQDNKGGVSHAEMSSLYAIAVAALSIPWPIVVLALASGKRATEACEAAERDREALTS